MHPGPLLIVEAWAKANAGAYPWKPAEFVRDVAVVYEAATTAFKAASQVAAPAHLETPQLIAPPREHPIHPE